MGGATRNEPKSVTATCWRNSLPRVMVTRRHVGHFMGMARQAMHTLGRNERPGVKHWLHLYRALLTGIYLLWIGDLEPHPVYPQSGHGPGAFGLAADAPEGRSLRGRRAHHRRQQDHQNPDRTGHSTGRTGTASCPVARIRLEGRVPSTAGNSRRSILGKRRRMNWQNLIDTAGPMKF